MLFWILLGLIAVVTIGVFIYMLMDGWNDFIHAIMGAIAAFTATTVVSVLVIVASLFFAETETKLVENYERELRAIGTSSTVDGQFYFLGGGYIDGNRTLNYMAYKPEGGTYLNDAYANWSTIYEDTTLEQGPYLDYYRYEVLIPWVWPWSVDETYKYDFHIPENTVIENYEITNN